MKALTRAWSDVELVRLVAIVAAGGSPLRAAAALKRTMATQNKARDLGLPFQSVSAARKAMKEKCAAAERSAGR